MIGWALSDCPFLSQFAPLFDRRSASVESSKRNQFLQWYLWMDAGKRDEVGLVTLIMTNCSRFLTEDNYGGMGSDVDMTSLSPGIQHCRLRSSGRGSANGKYIYTIKMSTVWCYPQHRMKDEYVKQMHERLLERACQHYQRKNRIQIYIVHSQSICICYWICEKVLLHKSARVSDPPSIAQNAHFQMAEFSKWAKPLSKLVLVFSNIQLGARMWQLNHDLSTRLVSTIAYFAGK